ncbi:MAG TPA: alcohol dehydrogenase catalytic domain-containing protein [Thermoanaerobacterales bacterium]|nr:alcohol dehydrogenase catalytic domain-containing protein [Thermoanaerobacterales bacterium]
MSKKTLAMVLKDFNKPLIPEEIEIPDLRENEILVRIKAAGVCGSDVHMWKGQDPRVALPLILGHEGVGEVVEINGDVKYVNGEAIKTGDMILWNRGVSCGHCYYCAVLNEPSLCPNRKVYGINISRNEFPYLNGCYSEYIIIRSGMDIFKVPKNVDPAILVSASCSGATTAHGFDIVKPNVGDVVLIQGPGPIGIFSTAFAKASGAREIIVIGGSETRLNLCKEFGATVTINRKKSDEKQRKDIIMDLTNNRGVDFAVEAVGYPEALREGLDLIRIGGTYLSIGFGQPMGTIEFDGYKDLVHKNLRIQGVWVSSTRHTHQAMNLVLSNEKLFEKMITHRFDLKDANRALDVMDSKEAVKAVLIP